MIKPKKERKKERKKYVYWQNYFLQYNTLDFCLQHFFIINELH